MRRECPRELEPFAVEQTQRLGAPVAEVEHPAQRERRDPGVVGARTGELAAHRRGDEDVLEHRHVREGPRNLVRAGDAAAAASSRVQTRNVGAVETHRPGGRCVGSGEHVEQGGLAGAVGADDADGFVVAQAEIDVGDGDEGVEALDDPGRYQDVRLGHVS